MICFWVLTPLRLFLGVKESRRSRKRKTSVTLMWSECSDQTHTDKLSCWFCMNIPCSMCLCTDRSIWLCAMCVCAQGMCDWNRKAVPEGSRQSKGVNSFSMARIHRSLSSISRLTWNWEQADTHCYYFLLLSFSIPSVCSFVLNLSKEFHFSFFPFASNPSLSPAFLQANYFPSNQQNEHKHWHAHQSMMTLRLGHWVTQNTILTLRLQLKSFSLLITLEIVFLIDCLVM